MTTTQSNLENGDGTNATASVAAQEDFLDMDALSEVIMAVNLTDRGCIGCAYYVARTETIHFMEDVQVGDAEMVDASKSLGTSNARPH